MNNTRATTERAKGDPSKTLFISMLTRDISLADCIVDLIDNSADGVKEYRKRNGIPAPDQNEYRGYSAHVKLGNAFEISDTCGGIPIEVAKEYAFRFGRGDDAERDLAESHTIGLYGIGMKRAMFKMGKRAHVTSSTGAESFEMELDVDQWRQQRDPDNPDRDLWDFELTNVVRQRTKVPVGTVVTMRDLYPNIARELGTPGFRNSLIHSLRRQYAFIIHSGLELTVDGHRVTEIMPSFRVSDDLKPMRVQEKLDGVVLDLTAGIASPPPEDDSAQSTYPDAETYGWYVVCNDRVVVTADKTTLTGWGVSPVPAWHPQFNGFLGVARFDSDDPRLLPWTTTKRNVDSSSEVYQRALVLMAECTRQFTDYTNQRKGEVTLAKKIESAAPVRPISVVPLQRKMVLPKIGKQKTRWITYQKPLSDIEAVSNALKLRRLSLKEVGIRTFDYFKEREVGQ